MIIFIYFSLILIQNVVVGFFFRNIKKGKTKSKVFIK